MNRKIVWIIFIVSWFNISGFVLPETVEENELQILFKIERSKDPDEIWYTPNLDKNGALDQANPVKVFWVKRTDNNKIEPLTRIRKRYAYGIKTLDSGLARDNEWNFQLAAYKNRTFMLKRSAEFQYKVFTFSGSKEITVERIFVEFDGGSFLAPNIAQVKLTGVDLRTGREVTEFIKTGK